MYMLPCRRRQKKVMHGLRAFPHLTPFSFARSRHVLPFFSPPFRPDQA
jgi:hypothetical protein